MIRTDRIGRTGFRSGGLGDKEAVPVPKVGAAFWAAGALFTTKKRRFTTLRFILDSWSPKSCIRINSRDDFIL